MFGSQRVSYYAGAGSDDRRVALDALTAHRQVMAAIYLLAGLVSLAIAYDRSWSGARYLLQAKAVTLGFTLIAVWMSRGISTGVPPQAEDSLGD